MNKAVSYFLFTCKGAFFLMLLLQVNYAFAQFTCDNTTATITQSSGTISDGSGNYSNYERCSFLISPENAVSISLQFTSFYTEQNFDYVRVYDGTNASAPLLGSFAGSSLPPSLTASSGSMFIQFNSDGSVTYTGFSANFTADIALVSTSHEALDFGQLEVAESKSLMLEVSNETADNLLIENIEYPFGFSGPQDLLLSPFSTEAIEITFTPTLDSLYDSELVFYYDAYEHRVKVKGFGVYSAHFSPGGYFSGTDHVQIAGRVAPQYENWIFDENASFLYSGAGVFYAQDLSLEDEVYEPVFSELNTSFYSGANSFFAQDLSLDDAVNEPIFSDLTHSPASGYSSDVREVSLLDPEIILMYWEGGGSAGAFASNAIQDTLSDPESFIESVFDGGLASGSAYSYGVATLDGINDNILPWNHSEGSGADFIFVDDLTEAFDQEHYMWLGGIASGNFVIQANRVSDELYALWDGGIGAGHDHDRDSLFLIETYWLGGAGRGDVAVAGRWQKDEVIYPLWEGGLAQGYYTTENENFPLDGPIITELEIWSGGIAAGHDLMSLLDHRLEERLLPLWSGGQFAGDFSSSSVESLNSEFDFGVHWNGSESAGNYALSALSLPFDYEIDFSLTSPRLINFSQDTTAQVLFEKGKQAVEQLNIHLSGIRSNEFSTLNSSSELDEVPIPWGFADELGLKFFISLVDRNKKVHFSDTLYTHVNHPTKQEYSLSLDPGRKVENYHLISTPLIFKNKEVESVLAQSLGNFNSNNWKFYSYESSEGLLEYKVDFSDLNIGKGYWLISADKDLVNMGNGQVYPVKENEPFVWELNEGWNLIGNPYPFPIEWDQVLIFNENPDQLGEPFIFQAGYKATNAIPTMAGAFLFADEPMTLKVPFQKGATTSSLFREKKEEGWKLNFTVSNALRKSDLSGLGMNTNAQVGKDRYDKMLLPRLSEFLDLSFDKTFKSTSLATDIVPTAEAYVWNVKVSSSQKGYHALQWDFQNFSSGKALMLYDPQTEQLIDMMQFNRYDFSKDQKVKALKVLFGDPDYISSIVKPQRLRLQVPYPNPFKASTRIAFSVPAYENVQLKVFNQLGEMVAMPLNQTLDSGFHEILWNGTDQKGSKLRRGIYFIQLSNTNEVNTQRIIIL